MAFLRKLTQSLTIAAGLFVAASALTVLLWPEAGSDRLYRLAELPLIFVATAAWGILCVAIARKAGWSARRGVGLAVVIFSAAYLVALLVSSKPPAWGGFFFTFVWFCRKVLYSDSEWNYAAAGSSEWLTSLHLNS